jgi:hypothetical protein
MSDLIFNAGKAGIMNGTIDLIHDDIKMMLVNSVYIPDADQSFVNEGTVEDPAHNEVSGQGYARKGLGGKVITKDILYDKARFCADSVIYPILKTPTVSGIIIFKDTGNDATSTLIMFIDSGFPFTPKEVTMTITWSEGGILTL